MNAKFAVLDGSSLFFRAFYALQLPPNARGVHTNAIHGFIMMLVKLLKELKPTHIVIAFDKSRTTFRTELYPDYKGTRDKTPEELLAFPCCMSLHMLPALRSSNAMPMRRTTSSARSLCRRQQRG